MMTLDVSRFAAPFGLTAGMKVRATAAVLALADHPEDARREVRMGALVAGAVRLAEEAGPRCGQHRLVEVAGHRLIVAFDTSPHGEPMVVVLALWEAVLATEVGSGATSVPQPRLARRLKRWLQ